MIVVAEPFYAVYVCTLKSHLAFCLEMTNVYGHDSWTFVRKSKYISLSSVFFIPVSIAPNALQIVRCTKKGDEFWIRYYVIITLYCYSGM